MSVFARLATTTALVAALAVPALPASADPAPYELDPDHSVFAFMVMHIGYARTLGIFEEIEGQFMFDEEAMTITDASVTVETDSIETFQDARDRHMCQADFFDCDNYPVMTFTMTGYDQLSENTGTLTGDLSLLGVSKPVTFDMTLNKIAEYPFGSGVFGRPNYVLGASGRAMINRSEWGMTYAVEGDIVGDEVELIIEFEAIRQN